MTNVLPEDKAKELCFSFIEELDKDSVYSSLLEKGKGKQFGILLCTDGTVYKAFSGQLFGSYYREGFVGPCIKDIEKALSSTSSEELHSYYQFHCWDNKTRGLYTGSPTGTGDCCEPKLLSYCYSQNKKPLSMACFFYGDGSFAHKEFTTPCEARCKRLLPLILGLDIVYLDSNIVVVNKPHGLLAIEGKGPDKQDSIAKRVKDLFSCISQPCIHRLDMATSGLMVLGLTQKAHDILSRDFEERKVSKTYKALVHGSFDSFKGQWILKQRLDIEHRPLQILDEKDGKLAITDYQRIGTVHIGDEVFTKLELKPQTGRTHQLRLACKVNGHPIVGDNLYGNDSENETLQLTATKLEFFHPITKKALSFEIKTSN